MNTRLLIAAMMAMAAPSEIVWRIGADEKPSPEELSRRKQKDELALAKAQRKRERKAKRRTL